MEFLLNFKDLDYLDVDVVLDKLYSCRLYLFNYLNMFQKFCTSNIDIGFRFTNFAQLFKVGKPSSKHLLKFFLITSFRLQLYGHKMYIYPGAHGYTLKSTQTLRLITTPILESLHAFAT